MWEYAAPAANETNTVEVLASTKLIEGVTCIVSRDLVKLNGEAKEFTDDWLAQANERRRCVLRGGSQGLRALPG